MLSSLFSRPLPPGTAAPDFSLQDQDGTTVQLSALKGTNVVLVFYPRDETPVCRAQLCEFRDRSGLAASKDTVIFGVNPQNAQSHASFRRRNNLNFPLLVDSRGEVCKAYHAAGLVTRRTVYLIGKDGTIRYARRGKPAPEEVLAAAE